MSMKETDRRWLPAERDALASEAIGGPSLTYWQDCWHRLCRNKTALLSMVVVVIVVLSAIFVPMFWPYSYEEQDLRYANIPPELEIYDLGGNSFVYVTSDYKCIDTDGSGHLLGASTLVKDDKAGRTYLYEINGKDLLVDYGVYFRAKSEFITQEAAHGDGSPVTVAEVEYLREYYGEDAPETVSLREAEHILEDKIDRFRVFYDGAQITPAKTVLNKTYIWGTDSLGRDLFIRVVYGARVSLLVGFLSMLISIVFGTVYGIVSGSSGKLVDGFMMRIVDILMSVPSFLIIITLNIYMNAGIRTLVVTIGLFSWMGVARIVRAEVLSLRERDFILASEGLGARKSWVITRHFARNVFSPVLVASTNSIASAILTESSLSYLGFGISIPNPSWGGMLEGAQTYILTHPSLAVYPGVCILLTVLCFNVLGNGFRRRFSPNSGR